MEVLTAPAKLWTREDVLHTAAGPPSPGVYAWYFREVPPDVPTQSCVIHDGLTLLYVRWPMALRSHAQSLTTDDWGRRMPTTATNFHHCSELATPYYRDFTAEGLSPQALRLRRTSTSPASQDVSC